MYTGTTGIWSFYCGDANYVQTQIYKNNMTDVLNYDPFKPNQDQVHIVRQYYELQVISDILLCGSI